MTPSEFKRLAISYHKIDRVDIRRLEKMFAQNEKIDNIIVFVNSRTIGKEWKEEDRERIDEMRKKLMERRNFKFGSPI